MPRQRTIPRICLHCDKEFFVSSNHQNAMFCSQECFHVASITKVERTCLKCGKVFRIIPSRIAKGGGKYCSKPCAASGTWWRGGTTMRNGYREVTVDGKKIYEHRHVMAQVLGRPLRSDEHVHHRNEDRSDNRPENLEVLSLAEHNRRHKLGRTGRWARWRDDCVECGTTTTPHMGRGLCNTCYARHLARGDLHLFPIPKDSLKAFH